MKYLIVITSLFFASLKVNGQIFNTTAAASGPTNYATASFVDSIYYYCTPIGSQAELTAIPSSGVPNWNFAWQQFDVATNSWIAYSTTTNAASSTISSLTPGGYRVTITDATSAIIGCYRAWIVEILSPTTVNVDPIPPGCGPVQLNGQINWGSATPYYEPPAEPLIIDANTEITVCFSATHTWISDLGFYLVGPPTCGSPSITLSPNPGAIGQNNICNSQDNVNNLCFTTEAASNFNACTAPGPYSGTYNTYGPAATPINWNALFGCDASQPGWAVQIYDCISADVGALTHATITITGITLCGDTITITYDSGNINSPINDNSCSPSTASIFTVPVIAATPVSYPQNFIWTANPNIAIPNATSSLTPLVNPGPTQNTTFTLSIDTTGGAGCIPGVCGGNWQDSELYVYTPPTPAALSGPTTVCTGDGPVNYTASVPGGTWSGTGIIDAVNGTFDPTSLAPGPYTLSYSVSNPCPINSFITVTVVNGTSTAQITSPGVLCFNGSPVNLTATPSGGTWSGPGITDPALGTFDPTQTGVGNWQVDYIASGTCPASGSITIFVDTIQDASFTVPSNICANSSAFNLTATTPGGTWSGTGITDANNGTFDPSVAGAGTWPITYEVGLNCPNSSITNIIVIPLPTVNAGADVSICPGGNTQLNASGAIDYIWTPGSTLDDSTISNPIATPTTMTTYIVYGTDAAGCTNSDTVVVSIFTPAVLIITGNAQICEGDSTILSVTGATNVTWSPTAGLSDPTSTTTYAFPDSTTLYSVSGFDSNGCVTSNSETIVVNTVDAIFVATPTSGVTPLIVDFGNNSVNGSTYIWDFGDGNVDTTFSLTNPQYTYTDNGTYFVTLTVISPNGCVDQMTIEITAIPPCEVAVPNVFSPNGDGKNDRLELICPELLESMEMNIFDRWGRLIKTLTSPTETWDGDGQSEGTFYYVLTGVGVNDTSYSLSGYITLTR